MPLSDNSVDVLRVFCPAAGTCGCDGCEEEGRRMMVVVGIVMKRKGRAVMMVGVVREGGTYCVGGGDSKG